MRNQRFQRLGGKGDVELPTKIQNCLGANVAIKVAVDVSQRKRNINHGRTQFLIKVRTIILQIDNALEILQKRSHYVATSRARKKFCIILFNAPPVSSRGASLLSPLRIKGQPPLVDGISERCGGKIHIRDRKGEQIGFAKTIGDIIPLRTPCPASVNFL